jgi:hypothetical protein
LVTSFYTPLRMFIVEQQLEQRTQKERVQQWAWWKPQPHCPIWNSFKGRQKSRSDCSKSDSEACWVQDSVEVWTGIDFWAHQSTGPSSLRGWVFCSSSYLAVTSTGYFFKPFIPVWYWY